jgi:nucleoid-associated protein YgaU
MSRRLYLVLLAAILIGVQPVFAEDAEQPTVDLEEVSDEDLSKALDAASDVELINKNELNKEKESAENQAALAQETSANTDAESVEAEEVIIIVEETSIDADGKSVETEEVIIIVEETSIDADGESVETEEVIIIVEETSTEAEEEIPSDILNNKYFLESQRLAKLAEDAYSFGDYDVSATFAEESIMNAQLSDEYVARRLNGESEEDIIAALDASMEGTPALPATYTVRSWGSAKDCFWNIAGRPWVYGNPRQWRVLYEANKSKLPEPNNPNLIEPGIVLDIPSLKGEVRQGAWDAGKTYEPINK